MQPLNIVWLTLKQSCNLGQNKQRKNFFLEVSPRQGDAVFFTARANSFGQGKGKYANMPTVQYQVHKWLLFFTLFSLTDGFIECLFTEVKSTSWTTPYHSDFQFLQFYLPLQPFKQGVSHPIRYLCSFTGGHKHEHQNMMWSEAWKKSSLWWVWFRDFFAWYFMCGRGLIPTVDAV